VIVDHAGAIDGPALTRRRARPKGGALGTSPFGTAFCLNGRYALLVKGTIIWTMGFRTTTARVTHPRTSMATNEVTPRVVPQPLRAAHEPGDCATTQPIHRADKSRRTRSNVGGGQAERMGKCGSQSGGAVGLFVIAIGIAAAGVGAGSLLAGHHAAYRPIPRPKRASFAAATPKASAAATPKASAAATPKAAENGSVTASLLAYARSFGYTDWETSAPVGPASGLTAAIAMTPNGCEFPGAGPGNCTLPGQVVLANFAGGTWTESGQVNLPLNVGDARGDVGSVQSTEGALIGSDFPVFVIPLDISMSTNQDVAVGLVNGNWSLLPFDTAGEVTAATSAGLVNGAMTGFVNSCVPDCADGAKPFLYTWDPASEEFVGEPPATTSPASQPAGGPVSNDMPPSLVSAVEGALASSSYSMSEVSFSPTYDSQDPSWVMVAISGSTPAYSQSVQPGVALLHDTGGAWQLVGGPGDLFVGCPPAQVPAAVLKALGVACEPA
jgi:hypothetical protein